ncbi:MAG: ABC transporter ATP-binding protein [Gammaproteobacteria bacterium]
MSAPQKYTWSYISNIAREHKRELIAANVIALVAAFASVPLPLLMPLLVDQVLLEKPGGLTALIDSFFPGTLHGPNLYIIAVLVVTVFLRVFSILLNVWQARNFSLVSKDVVYRIRQQMLDRLSRIAMSEYETLGSGTVTSHFITDLNAIDDFIGTALSKFIVAALTLMGITAVLLWMHWQLALFILLLNPLVIYFTMKLGKKVKELKRRENSAFEIFQQTLTETLDGIQQIRANNREKHYLARVAESARDIRNHAAAFSWKSDAASRASFLIFLFGFDMFRAISMFMVVYSDLSIGQMLAVFGYLWFMMGPVQEILGIQYSWFSANAALVRINNLLSLKDEPQYSHNQNPFKAKHTVGVEIRDITFSYGEEPVLNGVSLTINPGDKVALVGASGGGKSTLVQVILGLYTPHSGTILFDRIPTSEIGLDVVRDHVATVLQHPALFNDTVRMNLTLGRELNDDQLWKALEVAQLIDTVKEMPHLLDTIVGRQGVRLSGGQRQRLAIARMILGDPQVVILDEATSALDADTEAKLHDALGEFLKGRTTLIIAHRLSAVRQADRAYVFDDGRIIEEGAHEDLIRGDGLYSRLYGSLQR